VYDVDTSWTSRHSADRWSTDVARQYY